MKYFGVYKINIWEDNVIDQGRFLKIIERQRFV